MGNKVMPNEVLYHIGISAEMLKAEYALLPGDPGRVEALSSWHPEPVGCHHEYTSWLDVEGTSVLVCSTGMGGPSVAIGMEELARLGIKNFIRVGTTGSIQKDVELGDLVINKAAVRLDGTSQHYAPLNFPAVASFELTLALQQAAESLSIPYHT
ncbi:MAG: nucleoside phosphorylase, partial [Phascolarctobacterium faecium]